MLLDIPGPEDERTLGEVVGATILWDKKYIKIPGLVPRTTPLPSRRMLPTPPSPPRSPLHDYDHHSARPSRSPPPDLVWPSSPPPLPAKDNKRKRTKRQSSPKRQLSPLPKVPHKNLSIRVYDRTEEENAAIAKAEKDAHFEKKSKPAPPVYTEKEKKVGTRVCEHTKTI